jgi:hypothetical protein
MLISLAQSEIHVVMILHLSIIEGDRPAHGTI